MRTNGGSDERDGRQATRNSLWGGLVVTGLVTALLVGGSIVSVPLAATAGAWFGRLGHGHRHHGHGDPEAMREHAGFVAGWVLRRVDGTDAQQEQVRATLETLIDEVYPLVDQHRAHHEAWMAELTRPSIDREAIHELRRAEMELAEVASTKLADALADVAQVLTAEQRLELVELARHHHR